MSLSPASVLGARKVQPIEGQLDLFGAEGEPDTPTTEEQHDSTAAPKETRR
ncbi:hypothetical protein [Streptomyces sp. NPDC058861]|uniref:hypothetical protein n=1 Tax=Streptomyces sp. NPDC058861 TaxID=3346653 RepID=UPI0036C56E61